jgi:hypothetical protein
MYRILCLFHVIIDHHVTVLSEKFIFAEVTMNVVIIPADEDDDAESSSRYHFFIVGFNDLSSRCAAEVHANPKPPNFLQTAHPQQVECRV